MFDDTTVDVNVHGDDECRDQTDAADSAGDDTDEEASTASAGQEDVPDEDSFDDDDSDDDDTTDLSDVFEGNEDGSVTVESVVEAILFASDEPLTAARLVTIVETGSVKQIRKCIKRLNERYEQLNCAFRIEQIAGGYQMMTMPEYNHWLRKLLRVRTDNKLSQAAMETLAIIAYKQPIIRADVEAIRGVASGEVIRNLMYKGLAKIVGRAEVLGRPMLYGTTRKFLDVFGLNTLKDLPKVEELKKPE